MVVSICLAALVILSGCKSTPKVEEAPPAAVGAPAASAAEPTATGIPATKLPTAEEIATALKNGTPTPEVDAKAGKVANKVEKTVKSIEEHEAANEVPADKALGWLKNGNKRFLKGHVRKDGQSRKDIARLSKGQAPHAIVLSCSDSRVPPETVFDEKLGELFVIRTAGEALDDNVVGTIEYAVEHLGSRLLVVMGHTSCGAVNAAIRTINGGNAGSPALNKLVADIQPRIRQSLATPPTPDGFRQSFDNAKGVISDLSSRSEIIRKAVESGKITAVAALYNLDSGEVIFE